MAVISIFSLESDSLRHPSKRREERRGSWETSLPIFGADWWRGAMPTFEAWLVETYGSDLSKITEVENVPEDVTGTWVGRGF